MRISNGLQQQIEFTMIDILNKDILNAITDGIYCLNQDRRITFWNKGAEKLTGYTAAEAEGERCKDNLLRHLDENGIEICINGCPLETTMKDGKTREANVYMHHKQGHRVLVHVKSFPLRNEFGQIDGALEIFTKVTDTNELAHELDLLRQETMTDLLTGMANRRGMDMATEHFEESLRSTGQKLGILFVDIDKFKTVNDIFGHDTGDKVLTMVAKTILSALRPTDLAGRWGGEEFVIFIPDLETDKLANLAERLRRLIEMSWIDTDDERISVTASIGGAVVKTNETIASAIKRADKQLYLSKQAGRNCIHIDE